ncbi:CD1871A family CXXC motif-containing protein [Anaerosporobacter sp.]|nr:CD1871A family CXXC motif-containing protein [Anaerosporobacter sp.]
MKKNKIGVALLSLGVLFFIVGFYNGEVMVVLNKAIRICLECVGIG